MEIKFPYFFGSSVIWLTLGKDAPPMGSSPDLVQGFNYTMKQYNNLMIKSQGGEGNLSLFCVPKVRAAISVDGYSQDTPILSATKSKSLVHYLNSKIEEQ